MAIDFPASPIVGQTLTVGASTWQWDGTAWNIVPVMQNTAVSDAPPANPTVGQFWWRSTNAQLYVYYDDGNTKQWVQAAPNVIAPGGVSGVTDGSNAAAGMVGEFITVAGTATGVTNGVTYNVNGTQLTLQPGDWDVWGTVNFSVASGASSLNAGISTVSATLPGYFTAMNTSSAILGSAIWPVPRLRVSSASPTTIWLVGQLSGASGSPTINGSIYARRMR
jgi:hypothetical protein